MAQLTQAQAPGALLIARERLRQIEEKGWTLQHDRDSHPDGELVRAAQMILLHAQESGVLWEELPDDVTGADLAGMLDTGYEDEFGVVAKHRDDAIALLTIAGALVAAELDRLLTRGKHGA